MELRFKEEKWLPKITLLGGGKAGTRLTDAQMPSPPTTCTQTPGLSLEPASTLNKLPGPEVTCPAASVSHLPQSFCLPSTLSHFFFFNFSFISIQSAFSQLFLYVQLHSTIKLGLRLCSAEWRRKEEGWRRREEAAVALGSSGGRVCSATHWLGGWGNLPQLFVLQSPSL